MMFLGGLSPEILFKALLFQDLWGDSALTVKVLMARLFRPSIFNYSSCFVISWFDPTNSSLYRQEQVIFLALNYHIFTAATSIIKGHSNTQALRVYKYPSNVTILKQARFISDLSSRLRSTFFTSVNRLQGFPLHLRYLTHKLSFTLIRTLFVAMQGSTMLKNVTESFANHLREAWWSFSVFFQVYFHSKIEVGIWVLLLVVLVSIGYFLLVNAYGRNRLILDVVCPKGQSQKYAYNIIHLMNVRFSKNFNFEHSMNVEISKSGFQTQNYLMNVRFSNCFKFEHPMNVGILKSDLQIHKYLMNERIAIFLFYVLILHTLLLFPKFILFFCCNSAVGKLLLIRKASGVWNIFPVFVFTKYACCNRTSAPIGMLLYFLITLAEIIFMMGELWYFWKSNAISK